VPASGNTANVDDRVGVHFAAEALHLMERET
jgi:hypothetical protein